MTSEDVVKALKSVPPATLALIPLTWKLVDAKGRLDPQKVTQYALEIEQAVEQAQRYRVNTERMTWQCRRLLTSS